MEEVYRTSFQCIIERIVTNCIGFRDTPKNFSPRPEEVDTLFGLRMYLSAMESNVSLNTRNFKNFHLASCYLNSLDDMARWPSYHENFDLNTSKGIDDALKKRWEGMAEAFDMPIGDAA